MSSLRRFSDHTAPGFPKTLDPWHASALDGLPPARLKRLILEARQPHVGILTDEQAATMIDALGLKHA